VTRTTAWLLTVGVLLFIGVLASRGLSAVAATLAGAGWGLIPVAAFHALPLLIDAAAIRVLFEPQALRPGVARSHPMRDALLSRWAGESASSLMPAGQLGGPVIMIRHLSHRGMALPDAAAAITVSTTLQTFAQIGFALIGVALLGIRTGNPAGHAPGHVLRNSAMIASAILAAQVGGFYFLQRRGLFARLMRAANRFAGKRDWSQWLNHAHAIDFAVQRTYARGGSIAASFALGLAAWLIGTIEVYLLMPMLGSPVGFSDALLLESLGQMIRGAAFAIPGALGVQEGGYLLLASLVGLSPTAGLALSLAKRARELLLGFPGLAYWFTFERLWRRRQISCENESSSNQ
jgi:putative membrane protein